MMEKEYIQKLLDSYLAAETSKDEERLLYDYFCTHQDIPAEWRDFSIMFRGIRQPVQEPQASHKRAVVKWSVGILSIAAIWVVTFILMKPASEVVVIPSEQLTAKVQTKPHARTDATADASIRTADCAYTQAKKRMGVKPKRLRPEETTPVNEALSAGEPQTTDDDVTDMADMVQMFINNPEREAQLLAQLEEMAPEIDAYMDDVFAQAEEFQLQIGVVLDEADRQALELENQLLDEMNEELKLLYMNGD